MLQLDELHDRRQVFGSRWFGLVSAYEVFVTLSLSLSQRLFPVEFKGEERVTDVEDPTCAQAVKGWKHGESVS